MRSFLLTTTLLISVLFGQAQTVKPALERAKPKASSAASDISGYWITANKANIIEFTKSGDVYNGKIVWMRNAKDKNGKPVLDVKNPDKAKQSRQVLGSQMINNLKYNAKSGYYEGTAYQHNLGRTLGVKVKLMNNGKTLEVTAMNGSMLSRTAYWTRTTGVPSSLK
ncbi:hypothetical protein MASR1M74_21190 [Lentimicrobium sp.]